MDTKRLEAEIAKRNAEQQQFAGAAAQDIDQGQSPFMGGLTQ